MSPDPWTICAWVAVVGAVLVLALAWQLYGPAATR